MRRKLLLIGIAGIMLILLVASGIIATTSASTEANYTSHFAMAAFAPGPTPTAIAQPSSGGGETAIPVAIIGLIGSIVAALIAGGFLLYNSHRNQKAEAQATLSKQIQEQKEQERKQNEELAEAERLNQIKQKHLQDYRAALQTDSRIAYLQILNHGQPVKVLDMYIPIRVHQETKLSHKANPVLLVAEIQQDPTTLIHATQQLQERRYSSSIACDPDEAIRLHKRCVILGDPGAGKSTLLKYLALQSAAKQLQGLPDLPIHVGLHSFAVSGNEDLLDFVAGRWVSNYGFETKVQARDLMEENLQNGNALLLLDALDETMIGESKEIAEASYKRVFGAIRRVATRYPQSAIVITGRKAGYEQHALLENFTELEVVDFRPEDIEQFVNKWFQSYNDSLKERKAVDLNIRLKQNPRIQALAANPLLLTLIVTSYEQQLNLPLNRATLYKQCVGTLLSDWDAKRDILRRRKFRPGDKERLLEEIAWHFHRKRQYFFSEAEVLKQIVAFLPATQLGTSSPTEQIRESRNILEEIANENGLLKKQTFDQYGFLHFTLQEYFVAQYVAGDHVADHHDLNTLLEHRGDLWWEEVILLYVGQLRDASPVLHQLLGDGKESLREDIFHTNLLLAGYCLASLPIIREPSLRESIVNLLFTTLEHTPYTLAQEQAASALVAIGSTAAITRLVNLLSEKKVDYHVRLRVVQALGSASERLSVTQALLPLLSNKQLEWEVRSSIAEALGSLGEQYIVRDLLRLLADDQLDWRVRWSVAQALGILGEKSIAYDLVSMLANEGVDWRVRWSIAHAIGSLGEKSVAHDLLNLLANPKLEQSVCQSIIQALGMLKEQSIAHDLLSTLAKEQVDKATLLFLADALGRLGEPSVAPDLLLMLSNEQMNWRVRASIAQALSRLNKRAIVSELMALLPQEQIDWRVRSSIAQALGTLGIGNNKTVAPFLLKMLSNEQIKWEVRASIANALGMLGERSVAPGLQTLLSNTNINEPVRLSIVDALGKLGERSVARDLLGLLQDKQADEFMRQRVAQAILGTLGEWSVSPALLQLLFEEQILQQEPQKIADVLSRSNDHSVVPDLLHLLSEEQVNTFMRQLTVSSLVGESGLLPVSELARPDAIGKINKFAHQIIAQALGTLGEPSIVPDLLNLLSNKEIDQDVRKSIAQALGQLANDETTVQALAQFLQTSDIADEIYRVLWTVSRRIGVRVFKANGQVGNLVEIVKVEK